MTNENENSDYLEYELIAGEEDWEQWDEDSLPPALQDPAVEIDELMYRLANEEQLPEDSTLHALSDLSRADAETVQAQWANIPVQRRREVVEALVLDAVVDMRLDLGRILRIALYDSDPQVRRMAIEGLWEDGQSDLIGAFISVLRSDPETDVRACAAAALGPFVLAGELDELDASLAMRVEESLLAILRNEEEPLTVQSQALESISYSSELGVRDLIEDAYYSPFEEMRVAALNAMGRSADIRWRGLARAELANPATGMRVSAAVACGELEARAAVDELIALLEDEEQAVRLAAIFALGRLGGKPAREALQDVAQSEVDTESEAAEGALEEMLFYGSMEEIPLFDESLDLGDGSDDEPWDNLYGRDDSDLGTYG